MDREDRTPAVRAQLGLWDTVSIIVGIVIGSTIFRSPPLIMNNVSGPWEGLGIWALCGVLSLVGALCYAELASTYPRSGGDYVYLSRAFGSWLGFLFGWAQLAVVLTASTGAMAFVFADYAIELWKLQDKYLLEIGGLRLRWDFFFAVVAVSTLSLMNVLGVAFGKWTQNLLTVAKIVGLGGILIAGFGWGNTEGFRTVHPVQNPDFGLAMILVLYAYGGWNDAAFVAAELRDKRNIIWSLILGTVGIMLIYLAINTAYLLALGFDGVRQSNAVAADVFGLALGSFGEKAMCLLVMISALGAINGLIFTGSRVYATLGADHGIFAWLGRWHPRLGSPLGALLVQAIITVLMIAVVGTPSGQAVINEMLQQCKLNAIPWKDYFGGFNTLIAGSAPVFWGFFLLSGLSLFALRERDPEIKRPFSVPLFPLLPLIFCGTSFFMLYRAILYAGNVALLGAIPLAVGLPLYFLSQDRSRPEIQHPQELTDHKPR